MPRVATCGLCKASLKQAPTLAQITYGCALCSRLVCTRCLDDAARHGECIERRRAAQLDALRERLVDVAAEAASERRAASFNL
jgi:hypothetical protein